VEDEVYQPIRSKKIYRKKRASGAGSGIISSNVCRGHKVTGLSVSVIQFPRCGAEYVFVKSNKSDTPEIFRNQLRYPNVVRTTIANSMLQLIERKKHTSKGN
jgi:hypothetical protein